MSWALTPVMTQSETGTCQIKTTWKTAGNKIKHCFLMQTPNMLICCTSKGKNCDCRTKFKLLKFQVLCCTLQKSLQVHPQDPSIPLGPVCFFLIISSAGFCALLSFLCFSTYFSRSKKPHLSSSVLPWVYSLYLFSLSCTSVLVPTLYFHCIADFPPKKSWL